MSIEQKQTINFKKQTNRTIDKNVFFMEPKYIRMEKDL